MYGASHPGFLGALKSCDKSAFSQSMLQKGIHCLKPLLPDTPLGWIYCLDECCGYVNSARAWVRWVERRITAVEEGRKAILVLNHLANALFETMLPGPQRQVPARTACSPRG